MSIPNLQLAQFPSYDVLIAPETPHTQKVLEVIARQIWPLRHPHTKTEEFILPVFLSPESNTSSTLASMDVLDAYIQIVGDGFDQKNYNLANSLYTRSKSLGKPILVLVQAPSANVQSAHFATEFLRSTMPGDIKIYHTPQEAGLYTALFLGNSFFGEQNNTAQKK